ncbi:MAG: hypothetical protein A2Y77_06435 [Planctomycetes bacterium RBG_13_62_9]|nr:MAG: hypothetical protein A2Y77_06435 [Planctomycetes bacterium RBG_13_62_9]
MNGHLQVGGVQFHAASRAADGPFAFLFQYLDVRCRRIVLGSARRSQRDANETEQDEKIRKK